MKHTLRTAAAVALASLLCANASAKIVTIEIPGASSVTPLSINDKGQVTGYYDTFERRHGFLWQPGGTFTTFDVTGADKTSPAGISAAGVIAGAFSGTDQDGGFVRAADGTITTFSVPNGLVTQPLGTNRKGWIAGTYSRGRHHPYLGFLRSPSGATTEFSVPGATGSFAMAVNRSQTIAGETTIQGPYQGFVRSVDGTITVFGDPDFYTNVTGINDAGTIVGWYGEGGDAFFRTSDGTITTFLGPNGSIVALAWAINNSGTIVGQYEDGSNTYHGLLRAADGTFTSFDVKGAVYTEIRTINDKGGIAGRYMNKDGSFLGFAGKP